MSPAGPLPRGSHRSPQGEGCLMSPAGPLPRGSHRSLQGEGCLMSDFAVRCGLHDAAREQALLCMTEQIRASGVQRVRFAWCDQHGMLRGKTLMAGAAEGAVRHGVGMVGTLLLKDTSDRTAYQVFEPDGLAALPGFAGATNLMLLADPATYRQLPWLPDTGWVLCQPWFQDGSVVPIDTRRVLQHALDKLRQHGYTMRCGLEVEFHIYRIDDAQSAATLACDDPRLAAWPGQAPPVALIHPGYNLLSEAWTDRADAALRVVQHTAQGLGLPLISLETELGPSQVEAVFDVTDALQAADNMVLFRNGVCQALRRAGFHATFMCRPPFPNVMSSGWHLHQSLLSTSTGRNALMREHAASPHDAHRASSVLSAAGEHYLAGLLAHARGMAPFCTPTINGYGRFRPNALAPQSAVWGRDNRGAMLRVIGNPGNDAGGFRADPSTRIENRLGEPCANPYLYLAAQIHSGLDGLRRELVPPPATTQPYAVTDAPLPASLGEALEAMQADTPLVEAFGRVFTDYLATIKRCELARHALAEDKIDWERREYFSRI